MFSMIVKIWVQFLIPLGDFLCKNSGEQADCKLLVKSQLKEESYVFVTYKIRFNLWRICYYYCLLYLLLAVKVILNCLLKGSNKWRMDLVSFWDAIQSTSFLRLKRDTSNFFHLFFPFLYWILSWIGFFFEFWIERRWTTEVRGEWSEMLSWHLDRLRNLDLLTFLLPLKVLCALRNPKLCMMLYAMAFLCNLTF